jgi:hypothetical protein
MSSFIYYPKIAVASSTTAAVPFSTVKRIADAVGRATYYDYGYWWGNVASVYPFRSFAEVPSNYWLVKLMHREENPGFQSISDGGWHEGEWTYPPGQQKTWRPIMYVNSLYISDTKATLVSHEVLEAMGNPLGPYSNSYNRWIWSPHGCNYDGTCNSPDYNKWIYRTWGNEVCDPVWNWEYPYTVSSTVGGGTVTVSDFITPYWWDRDTPKQWYTKYDHLNRLGYPMTFSWWGGNLGYLQAGFAFGS